MTFQEKSALTMTTILVVVFGGYFTLVLAPIAGSPARDTAYPGLMVAAIVLLVVLAAASHAVLALVFRSQADTRDDERDRLIGLRSERMAGYVLAVGVCAGIGLAITQAETFWIAQVLIGALVLAEITEGIIKLLLYRRGT